MNDDDDARLDARPIRRASIIKSSHGKRTVVAIEKAGEGWMNST